MLPFQGVRVPEGLYRLDNYEWAYTLKEAKNGVRQIRILFPNATGVPPQACADMARAVSARVQNQEGGFTPFSFSVREGQDMRTWEVTTNTEKLHDFSLAFFLVVSVCGSPVECLPKTTLRLKCNVGKAVGPCQQIMDQLPIVSAPIVCVPNSETEDQKLKRRGFDDGFTQLAKYSFLYLEKNFVFDNSCLGTFQYRIKSNGFLELISTTSTQEKEANQQVVVAYQQFLLEEYGLNKSMLFTLRSYGIDLEDMIEKGSPLLPEHVFKCNIAMLDFNKHHIENLADRMTTLCSLLTEADWTTESFRGKLLEQLKKGQFPLREQRKILLSLKDKCGQFRQCVVDLQGLKTKYDDATTNLKDLMERAKKHQVASKCVHLKKESRKLLEEFQQYLTIEQKSWSQAVNELAKNFQEILPGKPVTTGTKEILNDLAGLLRTDKTDDLSMVCIEMLMSFFVPSTADEGEETELFRACTGRYITHLPIQGGPTMGNATETNPCRDWFEFLHIWERLRTSTGAQFYELAAHVVSKKALYRFEELTEADMQNEKKKKTDIVKKQRRVGTIFPGPQVEGHNTFYWVQQFDADQQGLMRYTCKPLGNTQLPLLVISRSTASDGNAESNRATLWADLSTGSPSASKRGYDSLLPALAGYTMDVKQAVVQAKSASASQRVLTSISSSSSSGTPPILDAQQWVNDMEDAYKQLCSDSDTIDHSSEDSGEEQGDSSVDDIHKALNMVRVSLLEECIGDIQELPETQKTNGQVATLLQKMRKKVSELSSSCSDDEKAVAKQFLAQFTDAERQKSSALSTTKSSAKGDKAEDQKSSVAKRGTRSVSFILQEPQKASTFSASQSVSSVQRMPEHAPVASNSQQQPLTSIPTGQSSKDSGSSIIFGMQNLTIATGLPSAPQVQSVPAYQPKGRDGAVGGDQVQLRPAQVKTIDSVQQSKIEDKSKSVDSDMLLKHASTVKNILMSEGRVAVKEKNVINQRSIALWSAYLLAADKLSSADEKTGFFRTAVQLIKPYLETLQKKEGYLQKLSEEQQAAVKTIQSCDEKDISEAVVKALKTLQSAFRERVEDRSRENIVLIGHSLGGAISQHQCNYILHKGRIPLPDRSLSVIVFDAPAVTKRENKQFNAFLKQHESVMTKLGIKIHLRFQFEYGDSVAGTGGQHLGVGATLPSTVTWEGAVCKPLPDSATDLEMQGVTHGRRFLRAQKGANQDYQSRDVSQDAVAKFDRAIFVSSAANAPFGVYDKIWKKKLVKEGLRKMIGATVKLFRGITHGISAPVGLISRSAEDKIEGIWIGNTPQECHWDDVLSIHYQ